MNIEYIINMVMFLSWLLFVSYRTISVSLLIINFVLVCVLYLNDGMVMQHLRRISSRTRVDPV